MERTARERFHEIRQTLRLPIVVAPMFLVSGPDMVVAAARAGVLGSFPAPNARTIDVFEEWVSDISGRLDKLREEGAPGSTPHWAMNLVVHRTYDRLAQELEILQRYRPPVVITALGSPQHVVEAVHEWGGLVIADVNSVEYARKAAAVGVDGLALVASGAGGHTGRMAGFAFVPAVREFFDGILILAGAIGDGRAVRAAEVLGAELSYMGTRFIAAEESIAPAAYKEMVVEAEFEDLVLSDSFTGAHAYYMRQSIANAGLDPDSLGKGTGMNLGGSEKKTKAWKDIWSAGQGVGTVHRVEPLAEIVERIAADYEAVKKQP